MGNQRFESAPKFRVEGDPVVIQASPDSTANLLSLKSHDGTVIAAIHTSGAISSTATSSFEQLTVTTFATLPSNTSIGNVSNTELSYLDGVTGALQTQLDTKASLSSPTLSNPTLTGTPTAPTASAGTSTTQIATTAFVRTEVSNLIASAPAVLDTLDELAAALGDDVNFATTVTNNLATKAPLASPALTGTPTAPTAASGTNTTQIATTEFVTSLVEAFLPAGMISPYAGSEAPTGWLLCAGQTVSRTTYARLFTAVGTTYNTGGEAGTDFRLPDLRGRVIAGLDNMGGVLASRLTATTITNGANALGRVGGAETHVLTEAQLASHTHIQNSHNHLQDSHDHPNSLTGTTSFASTSHVHRAQSDGGYLHAAIGATNSDANRIGYIAGGIYANPSTYSVYGTSLVINPNFNHNTPVYGDVGSPTSTASVGLSNGGRTAINQGQTATNQTTGSNSPHNNVQPTIVLTYIIKV